MLVVVMARIQLYADRDRDRDMACADADTVGEIRGDAVGVIVVGEMRWDRRGGRDADDYLHHY